ncbi:DEKNAAC102913 [Brettanomyces naardenensis]|uniref:DEKNAAC102913 n=1 Tax=Brettanomyces naardenensis TaxID=13370 RepID=A0A448YLY1_BRENA|nr:DEKNAAC102913 [Brettanomyces naardenensis]
MPNASTLFKRQKDMKRGIRFTMMVCGCSGTGKTSFVNSLLDRNILPHRFQYQNLGSEGSIPKTITYSNLNGAMANAADLGQKFDAELANQEPGIAITETSVEIVDEDDSRLQLTIVDTPGFGDNLDNSLCTKEICNFLEQQFDLVLAEETKVRRNPRFEDTRIHVCLYFIAPSGHGLRELDVDGMKKLSKYVNVVPVIGRADSFTRTELINFKRNINDDIERFKIPVFQFTSDEEEDDPDTVEESRFLQQLQPFALVTSDETATINGVSTRVRRYPWGVVDINDTTVSDFPVLRSVLLGSHLQDLKDITHDYLYENYRTERLSAVADLKGDFPFESGETEPPSMSNLAAIANSKSMQKFGRVGVAADDAASAFSSGTVRHTAVETDDIEAVSARLANTSITEEDGEAGAPKKQVIKSMLLPERPNLETQNSSGSGAPDLLRTRSGSAYSLQDDEELKSMTDTSEKGIEDSAKNQYSPSITSSRASQNQVVDTRRLRKISETVPYMLRHQTLVTKQQKLEDLERKSAIGLAKRAAELEKKAMELKLREKKLRAKMAARQVSDAASTRSAQTLTERSYIEGDDAVVD